jgi:hypothetical protein
MIIPDLMLSDLPAPLQLNCRTQRLTRARSGTSANVKVSDAGPGAQTRRRATGGQIRLLIDATQFDGWDSFEGFKTHAGFIRAHQRHVERLAVIAGHDWQRWLIDLARMVLHPDARAFDKAPVISSLSSPPSSMKNGRAMLTRPGAAT